MHYFCLTFYRDSLMPIKPTHDIICRIMAGVMLLLMAVTMSACSHDDETTKIRQQLRRVTDFNAPYDRSLCYLQNKPLPYGKGHLRLLAIGNSYTVDAVTHLSTILREAGVRDDEYSIYIVGHNAATLEHWWGQFESSEMLQPAFYGGQQMPIQPCAMNELLAHDWDVIVFQQYSGAAINYATFDPWLRRLIDAVQGLCTNPDVALAWQSVWSYADFYGSRIDTQTRWEAICAATWEMMATDGIDIIIPTGTAIENARTTSLNTGSQLTRDGTHLDMGIGRYIAACTWAQTLFAPIFAFTVEGNDATTHLSDDELASAQYPQHQVTDENRELCQRCAAAAVQTPFALMQMSKPTGITDTPY